MTAPTPAAEGFTDRIDFAGHLEIIGTSVGRLVEDAGATDLDDPVPPTPDWTVRELIAHLGMVHRWARYIVANGVTDDPSVPTEPAPQDGAIIEWLTAGADRLIETLDAAPDDLQALKFLKAAAPAKQFWARRQAHESTMHAVDTLAARHGRLPTTKEAGIGTDLALDGLDELLVGFVPRRSTQLHTDSGELTFVVAPTDADLAWTVTLSDGPPVTVRGLAGDAEDRTVLTGTAAALYLGLWNRGDEIAVTGEPDLLGEWRDKVRFRFS